MRMAFGLGGILITLGVIIFIMKEVLLPATQADVKADQKATDTINQISGRDDNGTPVEKTFSLFADTNNNGKLTDFQVTDVQPGSPMEKFFGLQANDVILSAVGEHGLQTDMNGASEQDGRDAIIERIYGPGQLTVKRGKQVLILPGAKPVASALTPDGPASATPQQNQPPAKPMGADPGQPTEDNPLGGINGRLHPLPTN